jgi:squalene/phytoene synthase
VRESDLDLPRATPALRELIAFQTRRATNLLTVGTPILTYLHGWARVAVAGYIAGGCAAARALRRAHWDVLGTRPKARRSDVATSAAELFIRQPFSRRRQE